MPTFPIFVRKSNPKDLGDAKYEDFLLRTFEQVASWSQDGWICNGQGFPFWTPQNAPIFLIS